MQTWVKFLEEHPHPHLMIGWTGSIARWRNASFLQLITAQQPSGKFSIKRDFDQDRAQYLVLIGFEKEADATTLGQSLGAESAERYAGYASQRVFEVDPALPKKTNAALKNGKSGKDGSGMATSAMPSFGPPKKQ
jgi:hypothetical protein